MPWDVNNAVKTLSKILNKTEDKMGKIMEGNFSESDLLEAAEQRYVPVIIEDA